MSVDDGDDELLFPSSGGSRNNDDGRATLFILEDCFSILNSTRERNSDENRNKNTRKLATKSATHNEERDETPNQDFEKQSNKEESEMPESPFCSLPSPLPTRKKTYVEYEDKEHDIHTSNDDYYYDSDEDRKSMAAAVSLRMERQKVSDRNLRKTTGATDLHTTLNRNKVVDAETETIFKDSSARNAKDAFNYADNHLPIDRSSTTTTKTRPSSPKIQRAPKAGTEAEAKSCHPPVAFEKEASNNNNINNDDVAARCFKTFVEEWKATQRSAVTCVDGEESEKYADYLEKKYVRTSLDLMTETPTVLKIKKMINICIDKLRSNNKVKCGIGDRGNAGNVELDKREKQERAITTPATTTIAHQDQKRLTWKCTLCGKQNLALETHKCTTCGRLNGYKGKNGNQNNDVNETVAGVKLTTKNMSNSSSLKIDITHGKSEQVTTNTRPTIGSIEKSGKRKSKTSKINAQKSMFIKQKLDYEADSREDLKNDINDILASIRSTINPA